MRATMRICLAACAALVALGVARADSVAMCKTRCDVGHGKCREPKESMLAECAALRTTCVERPNQNQDECDFGFNRCNSVWTVQLDDCDNKRSECSKNCDLLDTAAR